MNTAKILFADQLGYSPTPPHPGDEWLIRLYWHLAALPRGKRQLSLLLLASAGAFH